MTTIGEIEAIRARRQQEDALIGALPGMRAQQAQEQQQAARTRQKEALLQEAETLRQQDAAERPQAAPLAEQIAGLVEQLAALVERSSTRRARMRTLLLQADAISFDEEIEAGRREAESRGLPTDDRSIMYKYARPREDNLERRGQMLLVKFDPEFRPWDGLDMSKPYNKAITHFIVDLLAPPSALKQRPDSAAAGGRR